MAEASNLGPVDFQTSLRTNEGQAEDEMRSNVAADEEEVAEETSASSSDDDVVAVESKQFDATYARPPHRWAVLQAIRSREYGDKQHRNYQDSFR